MKSKTPVECLAAAVAKFGTQANFATELSKRTPEPVSQARVWNWLNRDGGAPSEVCPDIEALTGVRCEELCPSVNWAVLRRRALKTRSQGINDPAEAKAA